jgi:hypothetical protein
MPGCGGFNPCPARCGGGTAPVAVILGSLNAQMGNGYDFSPSSPKYIENLAAARILAGMRGTAERVSYIADPDRMSVMLLKRWETIFDLRPRRSDTEAARRAAVKAKRALVGQDIRHSFLEQRLRDSIGSFFVGIEYIDAALANVHVPDGTYPFGTVAPGYPWYSTVEHILVRLQKPTGASEADFYAAAGKTVEVLNPILPTSATFDWYRAPTGGAARSLTSGPTAAGFYLDQPANLDNNVFDDPPLGIRSVTPNTGPRGGGTACVLKGWGFTNAIQVTTNSAIVAFTIVDDETITFTTFPAISGIGTWPIEVQDSLGAIADIFFVFT